MLGEVKLDIKLRIMFNYLTGTHKKAPEVVRSSSEEILSAAGGLGRVQWIFWAKIHYFELMQIIDTYSECGNLDMLTTFKV